jgi:heat shock protein HslJ
MNKNTKITIVLSIVVVIVVLVFGWIIYNPVPAPANNLVNNPTISPTNSPGSITANSPENATYSINGQSVTLVNGVSEVVAAPGSASKIITQYFGNAVTADLDGDGRPDRTFILTQNTGGSGTFYYVVAALNTPLGYLGSEGVLLGDRIAPQSTVMSQDPKTPKVIVVNYADRALGESFAVAPSVGKSIWLMLDPKTMQFGEVAQNFEGEADPAKMTLGMKKWNWVSTTYNNGSTTAPRIQNKFILTFKAPNTFSAATDCNGVGGEYIVGKAASSASSVTSVTPITFTKMMSTLMYCDGSQEGDFSKALGEVENYHFTSKGELVFGLKMDSGTMVFK